MNKLTQIKKSILLAASFSLGFLPYSRILIIFAKTVNKENQKMRRKIFSSLMISATFACPLFLAHQIVPSQTSVAQAQSFTNGVVDINGSTSWFQAPYTSLYYDRNSGRCVTKSQGQIIQDVSSCRKTWYAIVRSGSNSVLFYDRTRGDIEVYEFSNEEGIGKLLHKYSGSARKTWKVVGVSTGRMALTGEIVSYQIHFKDDNGQVEHYGYSTSKGLLLRYKFQS